MKVIWTPGGAEGQYSTAQAWELMVLHPLTRSTW